MKDTTTELTEAAEKSFDRGRRSSVLSVNSVLQKALSKNKNEIARAPV